MLIRSLTDDEKSFYRGRLVGQGVSAHFTIEGNTFNPVTGEIANDRYGNVINKLVFWNFTEHDAKAIAKICNVKVKIQTEKN